MLAIYIKWVFVCLIISKVWKALNPKAVRVETVTKGVRIAYVIAAAVWAFITYHVWGLL